MINLENTVPLKKKPFRLATIVLPILVTQVALYMMTFFDILMTGRYDTYHLAGVTIGSSFWVPVYTGLAGILMGLTPIIAQYIGARLHEEVRPSVQQGLYVSVALAAIVFAIILFAVAPILEAMPLEAEVRIVAADYLKGMSFGLLPSLPILCCVHFSMRLGQHVFRCSSFYYLPLLISS